MSKLLKRTLIVLTIILCLVCATALTVSASCSWYYNQQYQKSEAYNTMGYQLYGTAKYIGGTLYTDMSGNTSTALYSDATTIEAAVSDFYSSCAVDPKNKGFLAMELLKYSIGDGASSEYALYLFAEGVADGTNIAYTGSTNLETAMADAQTYATGGVFAYIRGSIYDSAICVYADSTYEAAAQAKRQAGEAHYQIEGGASNLYYTITGAIENAGGNTIIDVDNVNATAQTFVFDGTTYTIKTSQDMATVLAKAGAKAAIGTNYYSDFSVAALAANDGDKIIDLAATDPSTPVTFSLNNASITVYTDAGNTAFRVMENSGLYYKIITGIKADGTTELLGYYYKSISATFADYKDYIVDYNSAHGTKYAWVHSAVASFDQNKSDTGTYLFVYERLTDVLDYTTDWRYDESVVPTLADVYSDFLLKSQYRIWSLNRIGDTSTNSTDSYIIYKDGKDPYSSNYLRLHADVDQSMSDQLQTTIVDILVAENSEYVCYTYYYNSGARVSFYTAVEDVFLAGDTNPIYMINDLHGVSGDAALLTKNEGTIDGTSYTLYSAKTTFADAITQDGSTYILANGNYYSSAANADAANSTAAYRVAGATVNNVTTYTYYATLSEAIAAANGAVIVDLVNTTDATEKTVTVGSTTANVLTSLTADELVADLGAVAKVGDTYYTTLYDAVNAAPNNGTVYVLRDYTITKKFNMTKAVTIRSASDDEAQRVTLTLNIDHLIDTDGNSASSVFTFDYININAGAHNISYLNGETLVIGANAYLYGSGSSSYGLIYADNNNAKVIVNGKVEITSGGNIAIKLKNSSAEINGTITRAANGNLFHLSDTSSLSITGGDYKSTGGNMFYLGSASATVSISGGSFAYTAATSSEFLRIEQIKSLTLAGGTFTRAGGTGDTGSFFYYVDANDNGTLKVENTFALPSCPVVFHNAVTFADDATAVNLGYVARVGETLSSSNYYKTLADAVTAANANADATTIYLLCDITQSANLSHAKTPITITSAGARKKITQTVSILFDPGSAGAVITFENIEVDCGSNLLFWINGDTLNVGNGAYIHGTGHASYGLIYAKGAADTSKVNILEGAVIESNSSAQTIHIENYAVLTISGGSITQTGGAGTMINQIAGTSTVNITGGSLTYNGTGYMIQARGTFNTTGGTFVANSGNTMVELSGTATISGTASFTQKNAAFLFNVWGGKTTIKGGTFTSTAAGAMIEGGAELVIEDGTFKHSGRQALLNVKAAVTVKGGNFTNETSWYVFSVTAGKTLTIEDGTFTSKGSDSLISNSGTVIIKSGTFDHTASGHMIQNYGTLTISGGKFTNEGNRLVQGNANSTLTVTGGTFDHYGAHGFCINNAGATASFTGGTFNHYGANEGILANNSSVNISISGSFAANSYSSAAMISRMVGTITIDGGTFTGSAAGTLVTGAVTIKSGTFSHTGNGAILNNVSAVTGGTFTHSGAGHIINVDAGNSTTISSATFTHTGTGDIINQATSTTGGVTIQSGTFTYSGSKYMIQARGVFTVTGGTFVANSGNTMVELSGTATISGTASFTQNNAALLFNVWGGNTTIKGGTFAMTANANMIASGATLTVESGTFTHSGNSAIINSTKDTTIKNGTFTHTGSGNIINVTSATTTVQGGTFTHSGSGYVVYVNSANLAVSGNTVMTHEGTGASYIYYRNGGNCAVTFVGSNVQLIAKGNNYIFEQGYSHDNPGFEYNGAKYTGVYVEGVYLSTERANGAICYTEQNPYMTFVNVKMDSDSAAGLAGIPVRISSTVGEGYYNKFNVAMSAAANNSTIYVVGDFTSSVENSTGAKTLYLEGVEKADGKYPTITHTAAALFNVQGGGKLTVKNLNITSTTSNVFYVTGTATLGENLIITHSTSGHIITNLGSTTIAGATITNNATGDSRVVAMNAGSSLTITSGTITNASDYLICQNNANTTVNISGGSLTSSAGVIFRMTGANTVTTISGGIFTQNGTNRILDSYSGHTLNISGGTFTNSGSSYLASLRGTVNISGGSFINNNNSDLAELSGTATISGTASFDQNGNNRVFNVWGGATTIKGGTFTHDGKQSLLDVGSTVKIEGGSFTNNVSWYMFVVNAGKKLEISGGTFTQNSYDNMFVNNGTVVISGGTFTHVSTGHILNLASGSSTEIKGGSFTHTGSGYIANLNGASLAISGNTVMTHKGTSESYILYRAGGTCAVTVVGENVSLIAKGQNYIIEQGYTGAFTYEGVSYSGVLIKDAYLSSERLNICNHEASYITLLNVQLDSDEVAAKLQACFGSDSAKGTDPRPITPIRIGETAGKGYYSSWKDAIAAASSNVYVLTSFSTSQRATIPAGAHIVIRGLKIGSATTYPTINDTAAGEWLIWVNKNSSATLYDINLITNGKTVTVDGIDAAFTAGSGTTIVGKSVATDTMVQMWGASNFIIAEGATFTVESQSGAMNLYAIYTNGSFAGKIEIAGKLEYKGFTAAGKTLMPVYVAASNSATQKSTLLVSGEIINNAICGSAAGIGMGTNGCQINVTGSVTLGGSASSQSAVINLGTKWNGELTVAGALINNDTGANAMASVIFYNQSEKNSTAAMIYINGGARLTLNSVNSTHTTVFRVNCNVDADATRGDTDKGIIVTTKGNSGTKVFNCPTLNPDSMTFKNVAFDIQAGIVSSASTTLTNCAFTSDAKAITYKTAIVNMNSETIVLDGITFQTGYYDTLWYAVSCLPEGDSATIYVLANHTATAFSFANRDVTIASRDGSIFTVTTATNAGNFINLNGNAKLTLENVTLNISRYGFRFSAGTNNHVVLNNGATMTLGNTEGTWVVRIDTAESSITVNDGALLEITSATQAGNILYVGNKDVDVDIKGGTFKNASNGCIISTLASVNISGGRFEYSGNSAMLYTNDRAAVISITGNTTLIHTGASGYIYQRGVGSFSAKGAGVQLIAKNNAIIFSNGYGDNGVIVEGAYIYSGRADGLICDNEAQYITLKNVMVDSDAAASKLTGYKKRANADSIAMLPFRTNNAATTITVEGVSMRVYTTYNFNISAALSDVVSGGSIMLVADVALESATSFNGTVSIVGVKKADGTYPTIIHSKKIRLFDVNKGADVTFKNVNFLVNGEAANLINILGKLTMINTNITVEANTNNVLRVSDAAAVLTIEGNSKIVNKGSNGLIYQPSGSVVINGGRFENLSKAPMIQTETGSITITQGYFLHEGKTGSSYILHLTGSKDINVSVKGKDVIFDTNLSPFNSGNAAVAVTVEDASFITHAPLFTNNTYKSRNLINLTLKDDATAALNGAIIRVGDGKLSTGSYTHNYTYGYFTDLATAVAAAKSGETIYFIADVTITPTEVVVNNKDLTFAGGSDDITVTVADTNKWLFNIKNGSDVTVTNLTIFANGRVFYMGGTTDASNPTSLVIAEDVLVYGTTANAQQMIMGAGKYFNLTINGKVGFGKNDGTTENTQCTANTYLIQIDDNVWEGTITVNGELWSLVTKKSADWHTIFRLKAVNGKLYINEGAKITQSLASHAGYAGVNGVIWNDGITVIDGATIVTNAGLLYIEPDSGKTPVVKVSNSDITVGTALNTSATTALNYADDATAALFGVPFRVGEETTDVHGFTCYTGYFTDLAAAVASVKAETPTTIYVMNDYSTNAAIVLNGKYEVTLRGLDGNCHTITETGSWLFNVKGGAKLTIADVNFKSNNNLFRVDAGNNNSYLTLDGNMDITMTGAIGSGDTIDAWGAAYIVIGEGVTLTTKGAITTAQVHLVHACGSFKGQIDIYGKITNSISGAFNQKVVRSSSTNGGVINVHESAVLTNDCVAPQNSTEVSVLYNYAAACPTVFNVYGKLVHTAPYGSLVYLCNGASLNIYEGAELVRDGGVNNNYGIYTYGGSSINIYGGSFTNLGKGDILYANAGTANVYGGYFEACNGSTVTVTSSATLNVYGGTFNYVGDSGTVFTNSGNLNVYGGAFRSVSTDAPIFTGLAGTTKLDAYVANGAGSLITNAGAGASTANHSNKLGQSFKNVITATAGAAPVIKDGQLVLRFKATVDKSAYAYLSNLAGSNGITFGMLVIPTADLAGDHLFTHNSLTEGTYLDIVATDDNITVEDDGCVTIRLELAEFDNTTKYSVVFYAKYQPVHGVDVYTYSNYTAGANSRSAEQIARMALNDISTTPSASKYPYEVMTGIYSPYTVEEYQLLQTYCTNATLPTLDIYIVAGGSTAAGTAPFNTALVKDYPVGNANIFYSGITSALDYNSNKYVSAGNGVAFGQGASVSTYGPEIGLANALSAYYNEETGKYAAIIKYAADDLSINSTYTYYDYLMETVQRDLEQYTDMGYAVNVVGMYWQQGEADYNDSYAVSAYKDRFAALVADMRADLTSIVKTVTGNALVNLEAMPVVVGEIGVSYNVADKTAALAFVEMQQSLLAIDNVALINSSVFTCADDVFTDIEDMLLAGEMVVANLLNMGNSSLNLGDTVVEVPVAEPMVEVDGVAMRSVIAALANAPAGSTVKLLKDIVLYEALALNGLDFTLDGNGHTIVSKAEGATLTVNNSLVTMKDVVVENQLDSDNAYAIELGADAHLTVTGATAISAYSTAIKLNAENSSVTIEGGFFATRAGSANNAIIDTTSANVRINGGSFVAGGNAACVRVGVSAPEKLVVNVTGGTFVADGYAFVNDSYYAIMVISPDADVTGGIYNAGFGNETAA